MKESKKSLIKCNIETLKAEIEMRYRFISFKKLHRNFLLNRIEKNNFNLFYETLEDMKCKPEDI